MATFCIKMPQNGEIHSAGNKLTVCMLASYAAMV